jgi:Tfp pilus assembly protein PilN
VSTVDNAPPETAVALRAALPQPLPAGGLARMEPLNLARRPFLNGRPVVRISLLLWLLGLILLLTSVYFFWDYLTRSADKRQQIARGKQEIERQEEAARQLQSRLHTIDLERLNQKVDFLNQRIAERTFSWSLLLDRLAEVLPNDVRLNRLAPLSGERAQRDLQRARGGRAASPSDEVFLTITGESRSDVALFRFVDNLFAHPSFRDPNPTRKERSEDNLEKFDLNVHYIPGSRPNAVVIEETPTLHEEASRRRAPAAPSTPARVPATPSGGQP